MWNLNETFREKFEEAGLTPSQQEMVNLHVLWLVSAAIGHRPYVENGSERTYPTLNIVIIAPTGTGKGSSCEFAKGMLTSLGEDVIAPFVDGTRVTSMKTFLRILHSELGTPEKRSRGEIRISHENQEFLEELDASISPKTGLAGAKCKVIDGRRISETLGRQHIEYPLIHYCSMSHITPEALMQAFRWNLVTNGYANRLLWQDAPKGMSAPIARMSYEIKSELSDNLEECIRFAALKRAIGFSPEAEVAYSNFCEAIEREKEESELMANMVQRFPKHICQLALVFSMLRMKDEIGLSEFQDASEIMDKNRKTIQLYLSPSAGRNIESEIINLIKSREQMRSWEIYEALTHKFSYTRIKKAIKELLECGRIKLQNIDSGDGNFPTVYVMSN